MTYSVRFVTNDGEEDYVRWLDEDDSIVLYRTEKEAKESADFFMESGEFKEYFIEESNGESNN